MFLTIFSNLIKSIINILKYLKPIYPLSSPSTKIERISVVEGGLKKGLYGIYL